MRNLKQMYGNIIRRLSGKTDFSHKFICGDDIFLVSYPRSGSTWLRYILAHVLSASNHVDREMMNQLVPDMYVPVDWAKVPKPRIIKSHEPFTRSYPNVVYLVRDGRDVACSYYDYFRRNRGYDKSFSEFLAEFLRPDFDFGSWPMHVRHWLMYQDESFIVVKYEDMLRNTHKEVSKICEFAGLNHDEVILQHAIDHTTYRKIAKDAGKKRAGLGKGEGVWHQFFTEDDLELFKKGAADAMEAAGYGF